MYLIMHYYSMEKCFPDTAFHTSALGVSLLGSQDPASMNNGHFLGKRSRRFLQISLTDPWGKNFTAGGLESTTEQDSIVLVEITLQKTRTGHTQHGELMRFSAKIG
ncbi:unnamed protein product [Caretta caretta]